MKINSLPFFVKYKNARTTVMLRKNIFPILKAFFTIFDRIICYSYYDFPSDCDKCLDNHFCLVIHIADIESASIRKFQRLVEQEERMKSLQTQLREAREEIQEVKSWKEE
jgi:hypothetical protein